MKALHGLKAWVPMRPFQITEQANPLQTFGGIPIFNLEMWLMTPQTKTTEGTGNTQLMGIILELVATKRSSRWFKMTNLSLSWRSQKEKGQVKNCQVLIIYYT